MRVFLITGAVTALGLGIWGCGSSGYGGGNSGNPNSPAAPGAPGVVTVNVVGSVNQNTQAAPPCTGGYCD
jgi:hypothetical protein